MCYKTGDVPTCNLPDVCGRKLSCPVCTAEVINQEVMRSVVTVSEAFEFLGKTLCGLNGGCVVEAPALSNFSNSFFIVFVDCIVKLFRLDFLCYIVGDNCVGIFFAALPVSECSSCKGEVIAAFASVELGNKGFGTVPCYASVFVYSYDASV